MMIDTTKAITKHLEDIMELLGIEETESNKDTPKRIAKMWANELFENRNDMNIEELNSKMTLFPSEGFDNLIVVKDIPFSSMCEHHFLPFSGTVSVGYVPDDDIVGLSKIPRVVRYFSKRPQLQERLTNDIGNYLFDILNPCALFVVVKAEHQCVKCRGAESDCTTVTEFTIAQNNYKNPEYAQLVKENYSRFKDNLRGD